MAALDTPGTPRTRTPRPAGARPPRPARRPPEPQASAESQRVPLLARPMASYYLIASASALLARPRSGHGAVGVERHVLRGVRVLVLGVHQAADVGRHRIAGAAAGQPDVHPGAADAGVPPAAGRHRRAAAGARARHRGIRLRRHPLGRGRLVHAAAERAGQARPRPLGRGSAGAQEAAVTRVASPAHPVAAGGNPARHARHARARPRHDSRHRRDPDDPAVGGRARRRGFSPGSCR